MRAAFSSAERGYWRYLGSLIAIILGVLGAAPAQAALDLGSKILTRNAVDVRDAPATTAAKLGRQPLGRLGLLGAGPVESGSTPWWWVDFEGGADGWVPETALAAPYFPPPETQGGWRSLAPYGKTPNSTQKATIRAKAGVDWNKLKAADTYSRSFTTSSGLLVIRNGYIAGEWGSRVVSGVASVSKSLTGLAVAKLFDMADADLLAQPFTPDTPAFELLPESWTAAAVEKKAILVRHLMTMTSGLQPHDQPGAPDYLALMLSLPMRSAPGERWAYASAPVDLLSIAAQTAGGAELAVVFNREIAVPIGAAPFAWGKIGPYSGASSRARTTPRDLARVGYLMMMDGQWRVAGIQRQLVSQERVRALRDDCRCASSVYEPTEQSPFLIPVTAPEQYGQLWWSNRTGEALGATVPRDAFYAHGYGERLLVVVPSRNLLVVRFGTEPKTVPEFRQELMRRVMASLVTATAF